MEITSNTINNQTFTITERLDSEIGMSLQLIKVLKNEDAKHTVNQLKELLIQYILANMARNKAELKSIEKKISEVLDAFHKNMSNADELAEKLKSMEKNPGTNLTKDLAYVQNLIKELRHDISTGSMRDC